MSFDLLGLSEKTLKAVADAGYTEPTPIQSQAIPAVLTGRDIMGIAQTGTGKTAGFTLPMIDILAQGRTKARMPRSLILEPTRELAAQVAESFETYGKHHRLNMALLIGGVSFSDQDQKLDKGVDVLIATPGRLLDHFERGKLMLNGVEIFVVDEADRMMDMGFIPDVERICKLMPQAHQTLFFSATMAKEIKRLSDQFLKDPKYIEVAPPTSTAEKVEQFAVKVDDGSAAAKRAKLRDLIAAEDVGNAIIFCNRKRDVDIVFRSLKKHGLNAAALHGDMDQGHRMDVLKSFKDGETTILVASDVAARGLDIPKVSHVFNYDVPSAAEDYIHRIGRTGRAGRSGRAFMLVTPQDGKFLANIHQLLGKSIPSLEGEEDIKPEDLPSSKKGRGGRKPKQESKQDSRGGEKKKSEPQGKAPAEEKSKEPQEQAKTPQKDRNSRNGGKGGNGGSDGNDGGRGGNKGRGGRGGKGKGSDKPVVGMGDHVPAFLAEPPKPQKKAAKKPARKRASKKETESAE